MMIRIVYQDGRFDMVRPESLDPLIAAGSITHFRRSTGWVTLGKDPVRDPEGPVRIPLVERRTH